MRTTSELCSHLKREVFHALELAPELHLFVLLDPNHPVAAQHPLHLEALARRDPVPPVTLVPRADLAHEPDICPRLVALRLAGDHGYPDEALVDQTVACALARSGDVNGAYVAGWLLSARPAEIVARHLVAATRCVDLATARQRVLPFFEPHRLALIAQSPEIQADPGLRARLLGPVHAWHFMTLAGEMPALAHTPPPASPGRPISLSREAWEAQHRIPQARLVASALNKAGAMIPKDAESAIDAGLRSARQQGLHDVEDTLFFCLNTFTLSAAWFEHPAAQLALRRARAEGIPLTDAFNALSDQQLDAIAAHRHPD